LVTKREAAPKVADHVGGNHQLVVPELSSAKMRRAVDAVKAETTGTGPNVVVTREPPLWATAAAQAAGDSAKRMWDMLNKGGGAPSTPGGR